MQWQDAFHFVLAGLASWRLAFLLAREEGPWEVFSSLRRFAGPGMLGKLLSCVKCVGMWISVPFAFFVGGTWIELIVIWLALSGVTALIDEWTKPPFDFRETTEDDMLRREADSRID